MGSNQGFSLSQFGSAQVYYADQPNHGLGLDSSQYPLSAHQGHRSSQASQGRRSVSGSGFTKRPPDLLTQNEQSDLSNILQSMLATSHNFSIQHANVEI